MKIYSTALFASALSLLFHSASAGEKTTFEVTDKGQIEPALVEHLKSKFESLAQVNGAGRRNLAGIPEGYDGRNNFYDTMAWLEYEGIIDETKRSIIEAGMEEIPGLDKKLPNYPIDPKKRGNKKQPKMYAGQPVGRRENGENGGNDRRVLYPGERMVNRKVDYWTDPETQAEYVNDNAEYVSNLMGWLAWQGIISEEDRDNIRADVATRQREVNAQLNANQGGRKLGYQDKVAYWSNEENLEKYKAKGIDHAVENGYMANENGEMENEPTYQTVNDDMIGNPDLHYTYVGKGIAHAVNGVEKGVIYSASGIGNAVEGSVDRTTTNVEKTNEAWANQVEKKKKGLRGK